MTGLEKYKKEHIEYIEKINIEGALETIEDEFYNKCRYCIYHKRNTVGCGITDCEKGIKAYLESEVE